MKGEMVALLKAPAKVNLYLYVVGKRADGKHDINSLVAPINSLYDEIEIYNSNTLEIVSDIKDNNLYKVFGYFMEHYEVCKCNFRVVLKKNIPIASGLGGSSTDAAAVINFLNDFYDLNISYEQRCHIASKFGSDMAYFIDPSTAVITGDGSNILQVTIGKSLHILIVNPGFEIHSKDCYGLGFDQYLTPKLDYYDSIINGVNQLEENACKLKPELTELIADMAKQKGCIVARMSGSGSSFFGLFTCFQELLDAKQNFAQYWTHTERCLEV